MKGLQYLSESTNFWNAIIGSVFTVSAELLTKNEIVVSGILLLFGVRAVAKGFQDYANARSIGGTNPPVNKDEK